MWGEQAALVSAPRRFSSDGVDIAFIDVAPQGRDLDEPILLIHGFASNHRINWVNPRWVETLSHAGRRVVAFDNRGHGESQRLYAPRDYRSDLMARDAANLLAHLRIERADVMGYSMGARIGAFLALDRPGLVRSLILGGLGDRLVHGAGLPEGIAEAMEAPSLEKSHRSDAAHVPRLRRADEERPCRARRLHPRLAPEPNAGGSGANNPADAGRGRHTRCRRGRSA